MKAMKTLQELFIVICLLLLVSLYSSAQSVGINSVGTPPDNSALLDLSSTDRGFLITRVDTASIVSPAFGLMTLAPIDSCLYLYNGVLWMGIGGGGSNCSCNCGTPLGGGSSFNCGSPFTDIRDNKTYGTVEIGNQCWMSENLAYLPSVVGPSTASTKDPYYYVYGYIGTDVAIAKNQSNYSTYGVLYNWTAAMDGASTSSTNPSNVQGACPFGWHFPSDDEWKELEMFLGMTQAEANGSGAWRGSDEGNQLKASAPAWDGTNTSGFNALGGGYRITTGTFHHESSSGLWWSATESGNLAWTRYLYSNQSAVFRFGRAKDFGYSVRCVKD